MDMLERDNGQLNREGFPMLAQTLDKKYGRSGAFVVRWQPNLTTVWLSDGTTVEKTGRDSIQQLDDATV